MSENIYADIDISEIGKYQSIISEADISVKPY